MTVPVSLTTVDRFLAGADMTFRTLDKIATLPEPYDRERAIVWRERWLAACDLLPDVREVSHELSRDATGSALLDAVFGNSPYLARCLVRHPGIVSLWATSGPGASVRAALGRLDRNEAGHDIVRRLRQARAMIAVAAALGDISRLWNWQDVTGALSEFAETACRVATSHLLASIPGGASRSDDPARESGFFVLALGKLGGRELNYSSDIDLMALWDDERFARFGPDSLAIAVRLVRSFIRLLQEPTADGFALRTDFRLRPDPGATPLAMSVDSAELYYESLGQNWERSAMIKARPVAGDLEAGEAFLARLRPFVWRRHLDFEAIRDIHAIRRKIHVARGGEVIRVPGHNLKLGRGGIREIEFLAQAHQLIFGGRNADLRRRATCDALDALSEAALIDHQARLDLKEAYGELRRVEHRLQMIDNAQTHEVPVAPGRLDHIATFLAWRDRAAFAEHLESVLRSVERHYSRFFESEDEARPAPAAREGDLVIALQDMGFADCAGMAARLDVWRAGGVRALRHERSRELVESLLPRLLAGLAGSGDPDRALRAFHEFLCRLPAGVRFFSLLERHPRLIDLVAGIMATAPRLAAMLGASPVLLDYALAREFGEPLPSKALLDDDLATNLRMAEHEEDLLDRARRWFHDREFRLAVRLLEGDSNPAGVLNDLANLRDVVIAQLFCRSVARFGERHGYLRGGELAILATGRYGRRTPAFGAAIDLAIIHHHDDPEARSDGPRPLRARTWTDRLVQRLMTALTVTTNAGSLFQVRLDLISPDQADSRTSSLERLHRPDAPAADRSVLAGARVVAATGSLGEEIDRVIARVRSRDGAEPHPVSGETLDQAEWHCRMTPPSRNLVAARDLLLTVRAFRECALGESSSDPSSAYIERLVRLTGSKDAGDLQGRLGRARRDVGSALAHVTRPGTHHRC